MQHETGALYWGTSDSSLATAQKVIEDLCKVARLPDFSLQTRRIRRSNCQSGISPRTRTLRLRSFLEDKRCLLYEQSVRSIIARAYGGGFTGFSDAIWLESGYGAHACATAEEARRKAKASNGWGFGTSPGMWRRRDASLRLPVNTGPSPTITARLSACPLPPHLQTHCCPTHHLPIKPSSEALLKPLFLCAVLHPDLRAQCRSLIYPTPPP